MLLREIGGADRVTEYLRGLGVDEIIVATTEREMADDEMVQYRNWSTPRGMLKLLHMLHEGRGLKESNDASAPVHDRNTTGRHG